MTKANLKTKENDANVDKFLSLINDPGRRADCIKLKTIMEGVTKEPAKMWGKSMVGFGTYKYKYASGREGEWFVSGFSPRKQNITVYIMQGFVDNADIMKGLGKYKTGKSCLYINSLSDVDESKLKQLISKSVESMKAGEQPNY